MTELAAQCAPVLATLWVLFAGIAVCGPACLLRATPLVRCALAMICLGFWSMVAFYLALLLSGDWYRMTLPCALGVGLASWVCVVRRWRWGSRSDSGGVDVTATGAVVVGCLLLPLVVAGPALHGGDPYAAAQLHYHPLPIDNRIPWLLAEAAIADDYKSPLFGDWLGSDRPPLQSGLIILMLPALGWISPLAGSFAISCAAQGLWILGAMVLLWALGMSDSSIRCGLVTAAVSGLVLVNGIFTWPKLMSGGFLLASAGLLLRRHGSREERLNAWQSLVLAGLLAGFAMQCHGSVAFAILPLGVFLLFDTAGRFAAPLTIARNGLAFAASFMLLQIPWSLWQKLGDPPGDRLLKWHLGGVIPIDHRGVVETIRESYQALTWSLFWENKTANISALFKPSNLSCSPWLMLEDRGKAIAADFYGVFPAMTWAIPTWLALAVIVLHDAESSRTLRRLLRTFMPTLSWVVMTVAVWVVLMFLPGSTVNHQGPMNLALVGLLLSGAALGAISPAAWGVTTTLQAAGVLWIYFGCRYSPGSEGLWCGAMITCVSVMILAAIASNQGKAAALDRSDGSAPHPSGRPESQPGIAQRTPR